MWLMQFSLKGEAGSPGPRGFPGSSGPPVSRQLPDCLRSCSVHDTSHQSVDIESEGFLLASLLQGEIGLPGAPGSKGQTGPKVIMNALLVMQGYNATKAVKKKIMPEFHFSS